MPIRHKNRSAWKSGWRRFCAVCLAASVVVFGAESWRPAVVYADTPAITDFGQDAARPTMKSSEKSSEPTVREKPQALFVTLYPDGHGQAEFHHIHSDAMVSFAGDHPCWRLDPSLMWFMQMPVYVKQVPSESLPDSHQEAV